MAGKQGQMQLKTQEERAKRLEQMIKLHEQGLNLEAIGKELGCTGSTVFYYLNKAGKAGTQKSNHATKGAANGSSKEVTNGNGYDHALERHISYAAGHTRAWLEVYADSLGVPRADLARGVVGVLRSTTRG